MDKSAVITRLIDLVTDLTTIVRSYSYGKADALTTDLQDHVEWLSANRGLMINATGIAGSGWDDWN